MTFEWALQQLRDGKKVYRKSEEVGWSKFTQNWWYNFKYSKPILQSLFGGGLTADDLEAQDWMEKC